MAKRNPSAGDQRKYLSRLRELPKSYLDCRDIRHQWETQTKFTAEATDDGKKPTIVTRTLACRRCGTERVDVLDLRTFDRISTQYRYADQYLIQGNKIGHSGGHLVRRAAYERATS